MAARGCARGPSGPLLESRMSFVFGCWKTLGRPPGGFLVQGAPIVAALAFVVGRAAQADGYARNACPLLNP
jgi:hypothetical protein